MQFIQDATNIWFEDNGDENESNNDTLTEVEDENFYNDTISQNDSGNKHEATFEERNRNGNRNLQWRTVYIYYTTADVITYSSDLMIDFPGFISSTGGNLGLFLGFSFMGMLFSLYEWMEARLLNRNVSKITEVRTSNAVFTK